MNSFKSFAACAALLGVSGFARAQTPTTTTLAVAPAASALGSVVTLTATVTPGSATGAITFYDGSTVLGISSLKAGAAQLTTTLLPAGAQALKARYDGSVGALASLSAAVVETVTPQFSGSLVTVASLTAGTNPSAIAIGDFNHDGKADLVIANEFSASVSVFLGNGSGGFSAPSTYASVQPVSVAVGDFNGDGFEDFAVAEFSPSSIQIYLGNGDGTFRVGGTATPGLEPSGVIAADFNGDGILDLATSNTGDSLDRRVSVILGNGDGTFQAAISLTVNGLVKQLVAGDFNADGKTDIAVTSFDVDTVTVLLGVGDGTFQAGVAYGVGASPVGLTTADFNGDGKLDLAVANSGGANAGPSTVSVLLGNGDGTFAAATAVGSFNAAQAVIAGDFNGDGHLDIAVGNYGSSTVDILPGAGNGTFYPGAIFGAGSNPIALAAADFNGDGKTDLAAADANYSPNVGILLGGPGVVTSIQGGGQVANLGSAFAVPFEVQVSAFSVPVAGSPTTFTAPSSGATGTFTGSGTVAIVNSNASGIAIAPAFVANSVSGAYGVSATASGGGSSFTVANSSASCVFALSKTVLAADSTGGVPQAVTITSNGPSCAYVTTSDSNWLSVTPAGGGATGTLTLSVSPNTSGADRVGHVTAGGQTITFTQDFTAQAFTDVPPGIYYFDAVNLLSQKGITNGCGVTTFCPTSAITRDEMAVFIVRMVYNGTDNFTYSQVPYFTDVPASNFYFPWIQKLFELGITTGCGPSLYCPTSAVTRDEMAIFIIRGRYGATTAFTYPPTPYFTDVPPSDFAFMWVQRLAEDQITNGCGPTTYCPTATVIRGDMAVFIMRGGFNVLLPPTLPLLTAVTPNTLTVGGSNTFTVTGVNTNFVQGTTTVVPVNNLQVSNVTVLSPTQFTVTYTAPGNALLEPASVYVQTGAQEAVYPNGITVSAAQ